MFSRFFIDRPIFAGVISITITLAGALAASKLPLAQYPSVTPPVVQVNCNYPGASAQVVAQTVAAPIEQQVNGVEKMLYMSSQCTNDGSYNLAVTFEQGVNLNLAQVLVQNRVNLALPMLPDVLKKTGVTTRKMSPDILMSVNLQAPWTPEWPDGRYDQLFLSNYALMKVRDELLRVPGISDIFISGQRDYSMRVWLDPDRLASRGLTAGDVVAALREQNLQVAAGQVGQQPARDGQQTQITLSTLGRLRDVGQFEDVMVGAMPGGRLVRVKDIGRVELGAKNQDVTCTLDGNPSVGIIIFQLPDANALDLADAVHEKMDALARDFPPGLKYEIQYDTTPYTRDCIREVVKSLIDAVVLVAFVVLLFLQNWRSAIIPLVAVPVAIIGTFGVLLAMGFSLNNLTLFGLVLAIGIVVDDAIVVVEAVEHHIELGMSPREATIKAMNLVSGPVVAVGLVLSEVFVPCAFISGITGQFFRQFALTIAASTIISTFNSLSLSPALAAILLRPREHKAAKSVLPPLFYAAVGGLLGWFWLAPRLAVWIGRVPNLPAGIVEKLPWAVPAAACLAGMAIGWGVAWLANALLRRGFGWFNTGFRATSGGYLRLVGSLLRVSAVVLAVYVGLVVLTYFQFVNTPKGFIPSQDMGYLMVNIQLPDAAAAARSQEVTRRVQAICRDTKGVNHTVAVAGQSFMLSAYASYFGSMFVILKNFDERQGPGLTAEAIAAKIRKRCEDEVPEALVTVLPPPPVRGVGRTGGFKLMVEDRGDLGLPALQREADGLAEKGRQLRRGGAPIGNLAAALLMIPPNVFRANAPQLYVDMNRVQCVMKGVAISDAFNTLQIYLGSLYVNDFNLFGRTWQVVVQAEDRFRNQPAAADRLRVRNQGGAMVPIGALADIHEINGPLILTRYNMYPASAIQGTPGRGVSSGQALDLMEKLSKDNLPAGMQTEWTELAFLEKQAGNTAMAIFGLAVVAVFLMLAALYESWSMPLAVILVVPMCLLSAVVGVWAVPMALQWFGSLPGQLSALLHHAPAVAAPAGGPGGGGPQIDINIFTQIGFVVLVGLASKNAILIVEFAKKQREGGIPRGDAALSACALRFRPIVMTSCAFILGVSPLIVASGAGAEMRRTLGTAVFSGMLGVTLFGLVLTPVFFSVIDWAGSTPLFRSRAMRLAGGMALFALFGWIGLLAKATAEAARGRGNRPEAERPVDELGELAADRNDKVPPEGTSTKS